MPRFDRPTVAWPWLGLLCIAWTLVCADDAGGTCRPGLNYDLTPSQWLQQKTPKFLAEYSTNFSAHGGQQPGKGFMDTMIKEFIGPNSPISCSGDQTDFLGTCVMTDFCTAVQSKGPYTYPALLVIVSMINFSRAIDQMIIALNTAQAALTSTGGLVSSFVKVFDPRPQYGGERKTKDLAIAGTALTIVAGPLIFASGLEGLGWLGLLIGLLVEGANDLGEASNVKGLHQKTALVDYTIDELNDLGQQVNSYISNQSATLTNIQQTFWVNGGTQNSSITSLLKDGQWLNFTTSLNSGLGSGTNELLASYSESVILQDATNDWLKAADVSIIFVPYGIVWTSKQKYEPFTLDDCLKDWFPPRGNKFTKQVLGSCTAGGSKGMSAFYNPGKTFYDPKWYSRDFTYPATNEKYDPLVILSASVDGYLKRGFNSTVFDTLTQNIVLDRFNTEDFNSEFNMTLQNSGLFNVPVCAIADLTAIPHASTVTGKKHHTNQPAPCTCFNANYTSNVTGVTTFFRDFATNNTREEFTRHNYDKKIKDAPPYFCT